MAKCLFCKETKTFRLSYNPSLGGFICSNCWNRMIENYKLRKERMESKEQ